MIKTKMNAGRLLRLFGWLIVIWSVLRYSYGFYDIYSDVSVRAFAPLVLIEGGFYLAIGLIVVFVGGRLEKRAAAGQEQGSAGD